MSRVIIVGSGVAGATLAQKLLESSSVTEVVMFEAGPSVEAQNERMWLDYLTTRKKPYSQYEDDENYSGNSVFGSKGSRLFIRGGATFHWGGWCVRFKPEDFELRSRTGRETTVDWPINYEQLAPYYDAAENIIEVAGSSDDDMQGGSPRFGASYPIPAAPFTLKDGVIIKTLKDLGYKYSNLSIARNKNCLTTGTCKYCPVGGRYSAHMTLDYLGQVYSGKFKLLLNSPVTALRKANEKSIAGVLYMDAATGSQKYYDADLVVVCAGTLESTKMLMAAKKSFKGNRVGLHSPHLGKHLLTHSLIIAKGYLRPNVKILEQELDFPTLCSRHFDSPDEQRDGKFFFVRDGRFTRQKYVDILKHEKYASAVTQKIRKECQFSLSGFVEAFETNRPNSLTLGRGRTRHNLPTTRVVYHESDATRTSKIKWAGKLEQILKHSGMVDIESNVLKPRGDHAVGTCRMSNSESEGVVTQDLQVYGIENLFVCSNAVLPNVTAVNPTLTLVALSIRLSDFLRTNTLTRTGT